MCTGVELALGAAALSSGLGFVNNQHALKRQDSQNAASIRRQAGIQQQADQSVGNTVKDLSQSSSADATANDLQQYLNQIHAARGTANHGFTSGVSDAYDSAAGGAQTQANTFADNKAGLFSRIDAPAQQRRAEGNQVAALTTGLGQLSDQSSTEEYLNQLRLHSIQPNPWLALGADALKGAGMAAAYSGFGAPPATAAAGSGGGFTGTFGSYSPISVPGWP